MLLAVMGRLTRTEFFGAEEVPATVATPLRLNCALPVTFSAVAFWLLAHTPVPLALSPRMPAPPDGTGFGVAGRAAGGAGILGDSANGTGVWASSQNATALKVTGKAQFSRSGVATVAGTSSAPKNSVRVSLPI